MLRASAIRSSTKNLSASDFIRFVLMGMPKSTIFRNARASGRLALHLPDCDAFPFLSLHQVERKLQDLAFL